MSPSLLPQFCLNSALLLPHFCLTSTSLLPHFLISALCIKSLCDVFPMALAHAYSQSYPLPLCSYVSRLSPSLLHLLQRVF